MSIVLCLLAVFSFGQTNGELQYIGDKAILQVWGTHYERGHAQGYLLGNAVLSVFNEFYYPMVAISNPTVYAYLKNYYQTYFDTDPRMQSEAQGLVNGMQEAGVSLYHAGLQRNLDANDVLLVNAVVDMLQVRRAFADDDLELGCASLSSWGVSTEQDSLLAGASVITRFLDWSQNSALIAHPVLVVHHPAETDEQAWLNFSFPGLIGSLSAISASGTEAFLNIGNNHEATNLQGLDPILFDLRRGIERLDYNSSGASDALDPVSALFNGTHLSGSIIHCLSENTGTTIPVVVETNNSGSMTRYYNQNGNLPGNHLAATNHFRVLAGPVCCTRYANIQDSLNTSSAMTAKRQWQLLAGAAGLETNLSAIQFTPSTGQILWSSATLAQPAYQLPALTLNASDLFSYTVDNADELLPQAPPALSLYPNPLLRGAALHLKSSQPLRSLELYNLRGQLLYSRELGKLKGHEELSLPSLATGLYLLRFTQSDGVRISKKLVVNAD